MSTPSAPTFQHLLNVLTGVVPAPHTKFLSFRGPLTPQQVDQLACAIRNSSAQGGIKLKGCLLGDSGAEAIAYALTGNKKLETLELPGNEIGQQGARKLLACMGQNTVLTTLDLEDNPCSEEAPGTMEEIDAALNRNRMLSQSPCPGTPTPGRVSAPPPTSHHVPTLPLTNLKAGCASGRHVLQPSTKENQSVGVIPDSTISRTSPIEMVDLDRRLQQLESQYEQQSASLAMSETELVRIVEWKQSSDEASEKVADVLGALQLEQDDHRSALQELGTFQGQLISSGQQLADRLVSMRHNWRGLEDDVALLTAAMSEGANKIREEAEAQAQDAAHQVRIACKGALDEVWNSVEALEAAQTALATLPSRVDDVEDDLKHMHEHTKKLDTYINDMLKEMLGTLNQGQEHIKVDVQQLFSTVHQVEDNLQHGMTQLGQALEHVRNRRQAALPWRPPSQEMMLDNIVRRLTSLESAVTEANKFAEAEAVRCEQTEAITENLQAQSQVHDRVLAQHSSFHAAFQRHSTLVLPQVGRTQLLQLEQHGVHGSSTRNHQPLLLTSGHAEDQHDEGVEQVDTAIQLASQAGAHAALQQQVQQQAAAIATLQTQLASLSQQNGTPARDTLQGPAHTTSALTDGTPAESDHRQASTAPQRQVATPIETTESGSPSQQQQAVERGEDSALGSAASRGNEAGRHIGRDAGEQQVVASNAGSEPGDEIGGGGQEDADATRLGVSAGCVLVEAELVAGQQVAHKQAKKANQSSCSAGCKQGGVALRTPWFTVRWFDAPHRFL